MKNNNLAFIDLETTGLDFSKHEIIEIGCVLTGPDLKVIEEFELKIKPENITNADPASLKVNRYSEEEWKSALGLKEAMKIFLEKVKGFVMVGHNISFDSGFLEYNLMKIGMTNTMHYHKLDTISIAWAKLHREPDLEHFSLRELCLRFGIENENYHRALPDAKATYELYKKLIKL